MMKRALWINAALAAAVAALALFLYLKPHSGAPEFKLATLQASAVNRIRVEIAGQPPIVLERRDGDWFLSAPLTARADMFRVQRLLTLLDAKAKDRLPATGLARFDLNEPYAKVTLNDQSFSFGAVNQMSNEQYMLTEGGVYLVGLSYGAALSRDALAFVSKQLFSPDEAPAGFEFKDFKLAQRDGKWELAPASGNLSQDDIIRWVDEWRLATALAVNSAAERKPLATIKVRLKNGVDVLLAVVQREPGLVIARDDQKLEYQFSSAVAQRMLSPPAAKD